MSAKKMGLCSGLNTLIPKAPIVDEEDVEQVKKKVSRSSKTKKKEEIDKSQWNGIAVYVDHVDGEIHPVTYELIGKARELASKIDHPVYALFFGNNISDKAEELLHYGVD